MILEEPASTAVRTWDSRCIGDSVACGILTCHWHHARFDLASGGTFDPWADDVPTAEIEVRDGEVWVATRTRYADGDAHWWNRLRQGMEHNIGLVIAKAVFGLIGEGVDPRSLVRDAVIFATRHRDGWGAGLTVLDRARQPASFPAERRPLPGTVQGYPPGSERLRRSGFTAADGRP